MVTLALLSQKGNTESFSESKLFHYKYNNTEKNLLETGPLQKKIFDPQGVDV